MFKEYEKVRIKSSGIVGVIVDRIVRDGVVKYIVESDEENPGVKGYGDSFPLFDCVDEDLELVT